MPSPATTPRRLIWLMHVSADGYVGGPSREIDWITVNEEIFHDGHEVIRTGDTALYGRLTYGLMEAYWPTAASQPDATQHTREHSAWVHAADRVVFSTTLKATSWTGTRIVAGDPAAEVRRLKSQPGGALILLGSSTVAERLLAENLIDDISFNVSPILLGEGIPLLRHAAHRTKLRLVDTKPYACGVVRLRYTRA